MARTLDQIDLARTAVETQLPHVRTGLMTTLRQNNLVLESEMTGFQTAIGTTASTDTGTPATGVIADIQNLTTLVADLRDRVAALEAKS